VNRRWLLMGDCGEHPCIRHRPRAGHFSMVATRPWSRQSTSCDRLIFRRSKSPVHLS
jgi:hypothetical protein